MSAARRACQSPKRQEVDERRASASSNASRREGLCPSSSSAKLALQEREGLGNTMPRGKRHQYGGVLGRPLRPYHDSDAHAALAERIDALFAEYQIQRSGRRSWERLALALAFRHVPGFRVPSTGADIKKASGIKSGRSPKLSTAQLSLLIEEVEKLRPVLRYERKRKHAIYLLGAEMTSLDYPVDRSSPASTGIGTGPGKNLTSIGPSAGQAQRRRASRKRWTWMHASEGAGILTRVLSLQLWRPVLRKSGMPTPLQ